MQSFAGWVPADGFGNSSCKVVLVKGLKSFFFFYLLMQLRKVLRRLVFNAAAYGYYICRALYGTYAASDAPIRIYLWFIVNHFYRIHRANLGAGTTADAFVQFGFANKIDRH